MNPSADHHRRPGRFFGLRGVVHRWRRARETESGRQSGTSRDDLAFERSRARWSVAADRARAARARASDPALQTERARFAANLDLELRLACRSEATLRRELGCAARAFLRRRAYQRLGFVRLRDYARERLGVSARTLETAAWLAARLDALPAVSRAYDRSELSWAQARAICKVAVTADEARWLAVARRSTVATLERLVAEARRPDTVPIEPDGEANEIDGEPAVRWRFACPARVRALWRRALELASRAAGEPLVDWRAAEVVAAEGSSGCPRGRALGDRVLLEALRVARRARRGKRGRGDDPGSPVSGIADDVPTRAAHSEPSCAADRRPSSELRTCALPRSEDPRSPEPLTLEPPPSTDPFDLDARVVEAVRALRTLEPRIGRLLRAMADRRFYGTFGHRAFDDYVRERLGISVRKAWALLTLEKATLRSDDFGRAYREGGLSWVRALALLPVLDRTNAAAWIARAEDVTVRRLSDEVEWVLASRDALGPSAALAPPPIDSPLPSPIRVMVDGECRDSSPAARLQIGAYAAGAEGAEVDAKECHSRALEVCDAEIRFTGPATVVALLRDVLDGFADPAAPRWRALERLLRHVILHWESSPRHPDPVFARDGWRCTVPACSSRRNLHDHHIRFRSRGGDNRHANRTTVCVAHHLHGLHAGTVEASGVAPHAIEWRLGVRAGAPPFLSCIGDRYRPSAPADGEAAAR